MSESKNPFTLTLTTEYISKVETWTLSILLIVLQILDGFLTFWGVSLLGIEGEGNPLLRFLMFHWGEALALFVVKSIAILAIVVLYFYEIRNSLIKNGLWSLTAFYLLCAVMPWSLILLAWSVINVLKHL